MGRLAWKLKLYSSGFEFHGLIFMVVAVRIKTKDDVALGI